MNPKIPTTVVNLFLALALAACSAAPEPGRTAAVLETPAWSGTTLQRDARGAQAFESIRDQQRAATSVAPIRMAVYALEPSTVAALRAEARAQHHLSFAAFRAANHGERRTATAGNREFIANQLSGAERFVDRALFHHGREGAELAEAVYLDRARAYVDQTELSASDGRSALYPYKFRRYRSAVQAIDSSGRPTAAAVEGTDQIAVAFAQEIDGIPVIGSGGKIAVHLSLAGDVVSHEASIRRTAEAVAEVDLLGANDAAAEAWRRVVERGIEPRQYVLVRSEFGYLRLGRSSIQTVIAPHYAFVFEPLEGVVGRRIFEVVPAVTDTATLALLAEDARAEAARKAAFGSAEEDERP